MADSNDTPRSVRPHLYATMVVLNGQIEKNDHGPLGVPTYERLGYSMKSALAHAHGSLLVFTPEALLKLIAEAIAQAAAVEPPPEWGGQSTPPPDAPQN